MNDICVRIDRIRSLTQSRHGALNLLRDRPVATAYTLPY
jgi:hypothetical protein